MTRLHTSTHGKFYRSQQVRTQGTALAFDEGRPEEVDPVSEICKWALKNLDQDQIEKLCESLSIPHRSASLEGMDDEEGVTGFPGGQRDGPQAGNAGPWASKLGPTKKNGAMDAGLRQLAYSVKKDADIREEFSFDRLFGPSSAGETNSSRDDLSLEALFGGGGDAGERSPSVDHLSRAPLWTTLR
jgi:hypothetical protein